MIGNDASGRQRTLALPHLRHFPVSNVGISHRAAGPKRGCEGILRQGERLFIGMNLPFSSWLFFSGSSTQLLILPEPIAHHRLAQASANLETPGHKGGPPSWGNASMDAFTLILHKEDDVQSVGSVSSVTQLGKILLTLDTRILGPKPFVPDYRWVPIVSCSILIQSCCGKSQACRTDLKTIRKKVTKYKTYRRVTEKFVAKNTHIKKERSQIDNLNFHLKKPDEEYIPNKGQKKEIT